MTDSSSIDNELVSLAPTAASVLGIKGPLRFRPHGSSQKAHVILRRVDPESDSEGEGETKGAVQFSLFAYKRIEVKPGKEILLTVADGPFNDRAIIFEGRDELEASSISDAEEETQVEEEDDALVPPEQSLPLKMRKPWAKRLEPSVPLPHISHPQTSHHSIGVQTDPINIPTNTQATLTDPSPAPKEDTEANYITPARDKPRPSPLETLSSSLAVSALLNDLRAGPPPLASTAAPKMGAAHPRHAEHDHTVSLAKIDTITVSSILSSVDALRATSSSLAQQDRVSTNTPITPADTHVNDKLERWSPSVPVPTALPAVAGPSDETSDSAQSSGDSEDGNPFLQAPERPWSPSVPAALSTLALRRYNIAAHRAEQLENANSSSETQPSLSTEISPQPDTPTPTPPTPASPAKTKPAAKSNSFGFVSGVGLPPLSFSDEDSKVGLLPEKAAYVPSSAQRLTRSDAILSLRPVEAPPSPSTPVHPPSPSIKRDHSPSRLSPASLRGPYNHSPLESSATNVLPHPQSPNQSLRKPQTLSWPPFRPGRDDSSADFYPPFRAGPDSSEQPPVFLPASGPGTIRGHTPLNTPARGRPAAMPNSNTIPIAPRHPFAPSPVPGRPSPPAAQPFHNSQPFGPSTSPKAPLKPPHAMIPPDNGYPPRQPRSDVVPQAVASPSLGPSMISQAYSQYPRHPRYSNTTRSHADGRGRDGIPMAAGTKRRASSPRTEPGTPFEILPKRTPPSTWPTASPIRCAAVQGEHVAIRAVTFNRTGKLMAVTCADCSIRIWDNVTYSEVARLPHSSTVVSARWMDDDAGVLALYSDGALMRWTRPGSVTPPRAHDVWNPRHLSEPIPVATPEDAPTALAYSGDRIAASFPKYGVYIWMLKQGSWQPQRPIDRQNVTAIEYINGGAALLGGTKDGVLWYCPVPDTVPRVYNFFKARICGIDVLPGGTHAVVSQQVGRAHLVAISQDENRGKVMQVYTVEPELQTDAVYDANALFVGLNDVVLYGSARGYLFVWDQTSSRILCGLDHGEGCIVQASATYRRIDATGESWVVTGSQDGMLNWWTEPMWLASMERSGKRIKTS